MKHDRTVFFISDRTGITIEMLGHSLLTQFDQVKFKRITIPFVDSLEKVEDALRQINECADRDENRPLVFSTLINPVHRKVLVHRSNAKVMDMFRMFMDPMEEELGIPANHSVGKTHGLSETDIAQYQYRIEAVNYAVTHDDGITSRDFSQADVILVAVSRCGKTPTCLYLALQFGIRAANYPLIPEDLERGHIPDVLKPHKHKLYGLTIQPERLTEIRNQRKPNSRYASFNNCVFEVEEAEALFRRHSIPFLNTTLKSIEELSTTIVRDRQLQRRIF